MRDLKKKFLLWTERENKVFNPVKNVNHDILSKNKQDSEKGNREICEFVKYLIYTRVAKQDHAFPYIAASQFPALFVYVLPEKAYDLKQLCGMWYHHTSVVMAEMKSHQI